VAGSEREGQRERLHAACGCFVSCIAHFALDTMHSERVGARWMAVKSRTVLDGSVRPPFTTHHPPPKTPFIAPILHKGPGKQTAKNSTGLSVLMRG